MTPPIRPADPPEPDGDGLDPADATMAGIPDPAAVEAGHATEPVAVPGGEVAPVEAITPSGLPVVVATQVRRPWRATARTVFQAALALATLLPFVATGVYGTDGTVPVAVGQVLVVAGAFSRVMALPQVEDFLKRFAPFLAAAPNQKELTQ